MNEAPKKNADNEAANGAEKGTVEGTAPAADQSTAAQAAATAAEAERAADPRVAELEAEVARLKDQHLRALAEAENVRRRAEREREDTAKYAVASMARELLPVADNLRRALESVPSDLGEASDAVRNLIAGVEMTERQLLAAFERVGIRKIDPQGEPFDPNFHQAMMEIADSGKPAGTVVQVLQPGYVIHDRVLRAAMVGVAKREPSQEKPHVDTQA